MSRTTHPTLLSYPLHTPSQLAASTSHMPHPFGRVCVCGAARIRPVRQHTPKYNLTWRELRLPELPRRSSRAGDAKRGEEVLTRGAHEAREVLSAHNRGHQEVLTAGARVLARVGLPAPKERSQQTHRRDGRPGFAWELAWERPGAVLRPTDRRKAIPSRIRFVCVSLLFV